MIVATTAIALGLVCAESRSSPIVRVESQVFPPNIRLLRGEHVMAESPTDGLWSIALGWENGWPTEWRHAYAESSGEVGDWSVMGGHFDLDGGRLECTDAYRSEGTVVHFRRRFEWKGTKPLEHCTLSVRWLVPEAQHAHPFMPGISYYGNPSGARTSGVDPKDPDSLRRAAVVVQTGRAGERSYFEEHRFPMPFESVEWDGMGVALHTLPSLVPDAHRRDQWWSMGMTSFGGPYELALLSGPCAANGMSSVVKARQGGFLPYDETWMTLRPGAVVEKEFAIETFRANEAGSGFHVPMRTAIARAQPFSLDGLPTAASIVESKLRFARSRWRDREADPGFEMYPASVGGTHYVMGWCGQAETMPYVLLALGERTGWADARSVAVRALDFLTSAPFDDHGFMQHYAIGESARWADQDFVSQGQALETIGRAVDVARRLGDVDTKRWEAFLRKACALHAARVLAPDWRAASTSEAFFVSPLLRASRLFDDRAMESAALKIAEQAAQRHMGVDEPYWGGTLDARCEDKEGAWAAFQAFLACFDHTREVRWLARAEHAMNAALSWTVLWDIDLPPGRLRDHAFKTRGWTVVSAQNQHLDVYGVMFTPEVYRMGQLLHRDELLQLARVMFRSCGQLIDETGSQGEQIQHTNFAQQGDMSDVERMRGGYSEGWTVFWITTHFLHAAARFAEMGVDLDRPHDGDL
ncbi:MAG: hypothetical protein U0572_08970 [Phycisphaerales bacterium]